MDTKVSLLEELKSGGYEASFITTFNAYLPFYEDVVLRKLASNGVRHNVLMMDQAQCQLSFANHPPRLAGRRYTLVPMQSNGAFHPKIILLLGKKKGLLAIGSHNMTLSGFGLNAELTNLVRYPARAEDQSAALFQQVWQFVQGWLQAQSRNLPSHLLSMVDAVAEFAPWLKAEVAEPRDIAVIASTIDERALLDQLKARLPEGITRVIAGGAFFDSRLRFLDSLNDALSPSELIVAIDPRTVKAPPSLADKANIRVVDGSLAVFAKDEGAPYLHAKYLLNCIQN